MHENSLPGDAPQFLLSKEAAKNASDVRYQNSYHDTFSKTFN